MVNNWNSFFLIVLFSIYFEQTQMGTELSHGQMLMQNGEYIRPSDTFKVSAISCNFKSRSAITNLWISFVFFETIC